MTTHFERIQKDTSIASTYNSPELVKIIRGVNARIHDFKEIVSRIDPREEYASEVQWVNKERPDTVSSAIESSDLRKKWTVEASADLKNYDKIYQGVRHLISSYRSLVNIEEINPEEQFYGSSTTDDYGVEGVSIDCLEAEKHYSRLLKLKKKLWYH